MNYRFYAFVGMALFSATVITLLLACIVMRGWDWIAAILIAANVMGLATALINAKALKKERGA